MPIFHTAKLVFIHIPKTGGVSVQSALEAATGEIPDWNSRGVWDDFHKSPKSSELFQAFDRLCPAKSAFRVQHRHLPAELMRELVPADRWQTYLKFSVVRNPWDLVVSQYHFLRPRAHDLGSDMNKHYAESARIVRSCKTFDEFVRAHCERNPDLSSYIVDRDGQDLVDVVLRFEDLGAEFASLCARAGIKATLPHLNSSEHEDYRTYYASSETKSIVAKHFARDIERFGYDCN